MSKDILGSLVRVLITVPEDRLGLVQDVALKLSSDDGDQWVSPLKQFLRKEPCWNDQSVKQSETVLTNRLKKLDIGNVPVAAMSRMKTADCLKKGITYRDGDLDNWLSDYIPAIGGGSLGGFELTDKNGTTYRQMAESLLQTTGSDESLKKLLKERGHTFHLEQVADLIRRTKAGEKTGLLDNGYANLLFVEDENGEVFGLHAFWRDYWLGLGWCVHVYRFVLDFGWLAGLRFFSRNKV